MRRHPQVANGSTKRSLARPAGSPDRSTGRAVVVALVVGVLAVMATACTSSRSASVPTSAGPVATGSSGTGTSGTGTSTTAGSLPAGVANAPSNTVWLCEPGKADDPCTAPLTTTVIGADGAKHTEQFTPAANAPIDCFYVYPTVSTQPGPNADLSIDPEEVSVARQQASQFSRECNVYAPIYRQVTVSAILSPAGRSAAVTATAFKGVLDAWHDYLAHHNHGRGVVLIGHSQGAGELIQLLRTEIDPSAAERRLLVSAILLGGNVIVPAGHDVGGDFRNIPACRSTRQTGCVIAFSTFDETPPSNAFFGRPVPIAAGTAPTVANPEVLCTNPAALGGGSGKLQSMFAIAKAANAQGGLTAAMFGGSPPAASTPWVEWDGWYDASCSDAGGAHVLLLTPEGSAPKLKPEPSPQWGLHLLDVNLSLGNLVSIVGDQAAAYHP